MELTTRERVIYEFLEEEKELDNFKNTIKDDLICYHHSLGQWIRNQWLWKEYDEGAGQEHPDDKSFKMIEQLHKKLNTEINAG